MAPKKGKSVVIEEIGSIERESSSAGKLSKGEIISASSVNVEKNNDRMGSKRKLSRKGKDDQEEEEEEEETASSSEKVKKARVVWPNSLHNQFLETLRHIGLESMGIYILLIFYFVFTLLTLLLYNYDWWLFFSLFLDEAEVVPKKIHEHMNVQGLTRENVASHLQLSFLLYPSDCTFTSISTNIFGFTFATTTASTHVSNLVLNPINDVVVIVAIIAIENEKLKSKKLTTSSDRYFAKKDGRLYGMTLGKINPLSKSKFFTITTGKKAILANSIRSYNDKRIVGASTRNKIKGLQGYGLYTNL
ncbi:uncharacterized protein LOC111290226 [Durio zibethinus]|uniref:Uncharacterized protein LOC111290226 n=1 Tax=Durio zibethinus TaxID=66656 RepID=A0A6P5YB91_DURZI|nr:uncharacterized protein LOC111290226 [Durio zibethinus]